MTNRRTDARTTGDRTPLTTMAPPLVCASQRDELRTDRGRVTACAVSGHRSGDQRRAAEPELVAENQQPIAERLDGAVAVDVERRRIDEPPPEDAEGAAVLASALPDHGEP